MTFWGVYLKPNEPYNLHYNDDAVPKRLRLTQATLGDATRNSPARSIVRCSIGDKPAIGICSLSVKEMTCCQLDLEFDESHTVIFSVMGPRGVYLAGYLIASSSPTDHQQTDEIVSGHEGKEKAIMENAGCSDLDLQEDELDSKKAGDKKKKEGCRKYSNQESSVGSHKKYINRQCSTSMFGRFLEEKRCAIEKKKRNFRNKKRKLRNLEAETTNYLTNSWDHKCGSDSRTEENCSHERRQEKAMEIRKKKLEKSKGKVFFTCRKKMIG